MLQFQESMFMLAFDIKLQENKILDLLRQQVHSCAAGKWKKLAFDVR